MTAIYSDITFQHLQSLGDSVRLCDSEVVDGDLVSLYHYRQCDDSSDELLKQFRGIVFASPVSSSDDAKLIMRGFPYTPELVVDNTNPNLLSETERLFPKSRFFDSYEGTILRVFFYKKWFVSTHKKLDASASRWGSNESFEDIFRQAVDKTGQIDGYNYDTFFNRLDNTRQYMFLLRNTKNNRIVSKSPVDKPLFYHVGTYINNQFIVDDDIGIVRPSEQTFENAHQLLTAVANMDPFSCQGIFGCGENGFFKLINGSYSTLSKVRGNEPNLIKRYLDVRKSQEEFSAFSYLYMDSQELFTNVEKDLNKVARNIHMVYMKRFISKQYAVVDPSRYGILKKCHSLYLQNREPITLEIVWQMLNNESPTTLYRILSV